MFALLPGRDEITGAVDGQAWYERRDDIHLPAPLRILAILGVALLVTIVLGRIMRKAVRRTFHLGPSVRGRPRP